jgi:hypothetical protein
LFYNHSQFPKGSLLAQEAYFSYCEQVLTRAYPAYQGPINPYQRNRYYALEVNPLDYQNPLLQDPLMELYLDGTRVYEVIDCSFAKFQEALLYGNNLYKAPRPWNGYPDRSGGKYVKQPHHHSKILSEQDLINQAWRNHKGFTKDYRRRHRSMYGRRKKICKQISNRSHRAWEKACLEKEQYEDMGKIKNKLFFDPWDIS